jgi:hypothetical protein
MFECKQNNFKQIQDKSDSLQVFIQDTTALDKIADVSSNNEFDVDKFISRTDSLLTKITGKSISLTYKIDTIAAEITDKYNFYNCLYTSDLTVIKKYEFDPGKGNRALRLWFIDATYPDTIATNIAFKELQKQTGKVNGENDFIPGLTYTNDYVIKTDKKIYWMNSGCPYAFFNHKMISKLMLQSLQFDNIEDSIWCKCGQPVCRLE